MEDSCVPSAIDAPNSVLNNVEKWLNDQNPIINIKKLECMFFCNEEIRLDYSLKIAVLG